MMYLVLLLKTISLDRQSLGIGITEGGIKVHGKPTATAYKVYSVSIKGNEVKLPSSPTSNAVLCIEIWGGVVSPYRHGEHNNWWLYGHQF